MNPTLSSTQSGDAALPLHADYFSRAAIRVDVEHFATARLRSVISDRPVPLLVSTMKKA